MYVCVYVCMYVCTFVCQVKYKTCIFAKTIYDYTTAHTILDTEYLELHEAKYTIQADLSVPALQCISFIPNSALFANSCLWSRLIRGFSELS